jgi:hypothetical protein
MKNLMRVSLSSALIFIFTPAPLFAVVEDAPCAVVTKAGRGVQVIPAHGKVITKVVSEQAVSCGAMLITHEDPLWIRLSNQTAVKLGPGTFLEFPGANSKAFKIYRGTAMVSGQPTLVGQIWSTPNAEVDFKGGAAVIQYLAKEKTSIAGCFNRKIQFRNKFNPEGEQVLSAGEMSRLSILDGRTRPAAPTMVQASTVSKVLSQVGLGKEEQEQFAAVAKQVFEDRSKSLVGEISSWGTEEGGPSRSIASVPQSSKGAIDAKEAELTLQMLRNRLYGTREEQARFVPKSDEDAGTPVVRAPASVKPKVLSDPEKIKEQKDFKAESKRVGKAIERLEPDHFD